MSPALPSLSALSATVCLLTQPHAWIDPHRRHLLAIPPDLPASLTNRLIVHRAKLTAVSMVDLTHPCATLLTKVWPFLPTLVYLIGARCLRAKIFARNAWSQLCCGADKFLALPLPLGIDASTITTADDFDLDEEIRAVGQQCIEQAVVPTSAWRDRLCLRLPPVAPPRSMSPATFSQPLCRQLLDCATSFYDTGLSEISLPNVS